MFPTSFNLIIGQCVSMLFLSPVKFGLKFGYLSVHLLKGLPIFGRQLEQQLRLLDVLLQLFEVCLQVVQFILPSLLQQDLVEHAA